MSESRKSGPGPDDSEELQSNAMMQVGDLQPSEVSPFQGAPGLLRSVSNVLNGSPDHQMRLARLGRRRLEALRNSNPDFVARREIGEEVLPLERVIDCPGVCGERLPAVDFARISDLAAAMLARDDEVDPESEKVEVRRDALTLISGAARIASVVAPDLQGELPLNFMEMARTIAIPLAQSRQIGNPEQWQSEVGRIQEAVAYAADLFTMAAITDDVGELG